MKIRIRGNSLRLRLTQSEVRSLDENSQISDQIQFSSQPQDALTYEIVLSDSSTEITASYTSQKIQVQIPTPQGKKWAHSEQVSLENHLPIGSDESLRILVEKDFACLQEREGEDDSDAFENPHSSC